MNSSMAVLAATVPSLADSGLDFVRAEVRTICAKQGVEVCVDDVCYWCDAIEAAGLFVFNQGDIVLASIPRSRDANVRGVIMGRIRSLMGSANPEGRPLEINSDHGVTLRAGGASVELRSNGQLLLKGEDVTIHAKGTQRIRAGTVAIN
jgi:hypothetical protein